MAIIAAPGQASGSARLVAQSLGCGAKELAFVFMRGAKWKTRRHPVLLSCMVYVSQRRTVAAADIQLYMMCAVMRFSAGSSMPSVGTQTHTSLAIGGAYDGSPRCPAPASQQWLLDQKPSWRKETRRAGVRQRPRRPDQRVLRHEGINTHGGHMAAVVWDWITEPQSLDQTQAETCGGARSQS